MLSQWAGDGKGDVDLNSIGDLLGDMDASASAPRFQKTRMCSFFPQGLCKKGSDCTFAHGEEDLGSFHAASPTGAGAGGSASGSCRWCLAGECWKHQPGQDFGKGKGFKDGGKESWDSGKGFKDGGKGSWDGGKGFKDSFKGGKEKGPCIWCMKGECWKHEGGKGKGSFGSDTGSFDSFTGSFDSFTGGDEGKGKGGKSQGVQLRPDCRWCVDRPCWKHAKELNGSDEGKGVQISPPSRSEPYVIGKGYSKAKTVGKGFESSDDYSDGDSGYGKGKGFKKGGWKGSGDSWGGEAGKGYGSWE